MKVVGSPYNFPPKPHVVQLRFLFGQQKPEAILAPSFQPPDVSSMETILEPPHFEGGAAGGWTASLPVRGVVVA